MIDRSGTTDFPKKSLGKKIIIFFSMVPYPLRKHGVSIRYFPIIEHLSKSHTLDLVIFHAIPSEKESYDALRKYCRNVSYIQNPKYIPHAIFSKLITYCRYAIPSSPPLSFVAHGGGVQRIITEQSGKDRYDLLLWVGAFLLPDLLAAMPLKTVDRFVVDFIDSPSLIKERWRMETFRLDSLERYELWKTIRWEGEVIRRMDETIYISDVDSRMVPEEFTPGKRRHVIRNGVEFGSYSADKFDGIVSPNIGFLGNMAYPPNVEAVHWLCENVFLPMKNTMKNLSLIIIGRNPVDSVRDLARHRGVLVTGTVENIWQYVNSIDLFVFPVLVGAGLKNKVLEAMYARKPVLTTEIGNEGINAVPGRDIFICSTPDEFQREAIRLLHLPEEQINIGNSAHEFIRKNFSWDKILKDYENILFETNILEPQWEKS
jgi:glycosyltransferase involved in cell wall biosynthesis